jgi:hypothetical protein
MCIMVGWGGYDVSGVLDTSAHGVIQGAWWELAFVGSIYRWGMGVHTVERSST